MDSKVNNDKYYGFVAHSATRAAELFLTALNHMQTDGPRREIHVMDVGCGPGNILCAFQGAFASTKQYRDNFALCAHGIEHEKESAEYAKVVAAEVVVGDALKVESQYLGIEDMDIIFSYHPIKGRKDMEKLERRLVSKMRVGAVLILPLPSAANSAHHWVDQDERMRAVPIEYRSYNVMWIKVKKR